MRRPLISANWKMNHNHFEAIQCVQKLAYLVTKDDLEHVDVSIHPPFTDIRSVQTVIDVDKLLFAVGAQNCHWEDKGAFTGEVSPLFLAKLNVQYVITGHSERRQLFGETDADVARKLVAIQRHSITIDGARRSGSPRFISPPCPRSCVRCDGEMHLMHPETVVQN